MKKYLTVIILFILIFLISPTVSANNPNTDRDITSAITVIREKTKLRKSGKLRSSIKFEKADFDEIFCEDDYDFIVIDIVPEKTSGILRLDGKEVEAGESIPKNELGKLDFIFTGDTEATTFFSFSNPDSSAFFECDLSSFEEKPVMECTDREFATYKNVAIQRKLKDETDEEGSFELLSLPQHGVIEIKSRTKAEIKYTPDRNFVGNDGFRFRLVDKYGNRGRICECNITVSKTKKNLYFVDMVNDASHAECLEAVLCGMMDHFLTPDNLPCFKPEKPCRESDLYAFFENEEAVEASQKSGKTITFGDVKRIIISIADKELSGNVSEEDIEKLFPDDFKDSDVVTRRDLARILLGISDYFSP